jgi:hypothetical protein
MKLFKFLFSIFIFSLVGSVSFARLELPRNLNKNERQKVVEILGFSTVTKILGNPYPMGGYSGLEMGYVMEVISTAELASLGGKTSTQGEASFSSISLGKGLYNNIDVLLQFSPFAQEESITEFGGQLRWGFYQADFLPLHLTLAGSANNVNYQNKVNMFTQGVDLVAGFTVEDLTLYMGIGTVRAIGSFIGGTNGVTDTGQTMSEDMSQVHYLAGVNLRFSKVFLAMQLDRVAQSTYSAKLGVRF